MVVAVESTELKLACPYYFTKTCMPILIYFDVPQGKAEQEGW
jgi:hypothetical protein